MLLRYAEADLAEEDQRLSLRGGKTARGELEREIPAIPQAMIYYSLQITPRAMLSRAVAGTRRNSLILNLPGSEKAARENLSAVLGALDHALKMIAGGGH